MLAASKVFVLVLGIGFGVWAAGYGSASQAAPVHRIGGVRPPIGASKAPLTEGECTKLGGSVVNAAKGICASGKYCSAKDQAGKTHEVCINNKQ